MHTPMRVFDWVIDALMWVACLTGVLMMLHTAADVFFRNVFNSPIDGTIEIVSSYYMVAIAFFPLAYITRGEGQITVDLFTRMLARRSLGRLDTFVYASSALFLLVFAWRSAHTAMAKMRQGEVWESAGGYLAVWPARWLLVIGVLAMALCTLRLAIAGLRGGIEGLDKARREPKESMEESAR